MPVALLSIAFVAALLAGAAQAQAQPAYPAKPIRLIVTSPPGGSQDFLARLLGQGLTPLLGQQVLVENRTGASGIIGTEFVVKSAPDGYTLLVGSQTTQAVVPAMYKTSYDGVRDFVPVTVIATSPLLIVAHPSLPVKTVKDLIALAKARPGQLTFGAASGGTPHMAGELFKLTAKADLLFVPYKGEGPAVSDAMGGQISMVFSNLPVVLPLVRTGRLRGIAVTSAQRVSTAAEFPTVAESGLPGFEANTWFGCLAPAGTPADIINKLNAESGRALNAPALKERLAGMGLFVVANKPEEFAELLKKEIPRWAKVVKDSGVKPQ